MALEFIKRLFGRSEDRPSIVQVLTPSVVGPDRPATRLLVAGVTVVGLAIAGSIALTSLVTLVGALLALYFLLNQVLGIELDMDPKAFVAQAQRYAAQAGRN